MTKEELKPRVQAGFAVAGALTGLVIANRRSEDASGFVLGFVVYAAVGLLGGLAIGWMVKNSAATLLATGTDVAKEEK